MKVWELREALEDYDPEAEVYIASQVSWPFEITLAGVISRADIGGCSEPNLTWDGPDAAATDVLLVEGKQVRYGNQRAWEVVE